MEHFDWSGERSILIGRALTNQDAEFLAAVKNEPFDWSGERSILIGRTPTNQDAKLVRMLKNQSNRSMLARGDAGLPPSSISNINITNIE